MFVIYYGGHSYKFGMNLMNINHFFKQCNYCFQCLMNFKNISHDLKMTYL